jgi:type I pantothenate kinase
MTQQRDGNEYVTIGPGEWLHAAGAAATGPRDPYAFLAALLSRHRDRLEVSSAWRPPFVVGITGGVAIGKSTTAVILQSRLSAAPGRRVDVVATDDFLYPNPVLLSRGVFNRKGFPETYDYAAIVRLLAALRAGGDRVTTPVYSHETYDIVPGELRVIEAPQAVILEGLNVLQAAPAGADAAGNIGDHLDLSVYLDADEADIESWFTARFLGLRDTLFRNNPAFGAYAGLSDQEAETMAGYVWRAINGPNLREHIVPTRDRADVVLEKAPDHAVRRIRVRRALLA